MRNVQQALDRVADNNKCPKCLHDGNGVHLCRGGNLFKTLIKRAEKNGVLLCNKREERNGN
jgi:hypothetical protein